MPSTTHRPRLSRLALLGSLALACSLAAACEKQETQTPETRSSSSSRADELAATQGTDEEFQAIAKGVADAYNALGYGDVEGAVARFPEQIVWETRGGASDSVAGREDLFNYFRNSGRSSKIAAERVFLADDEVVISQGVLIEQSKGAGFVAIGRIIAGEIAEVEEFRTSAPADSKGPSLPSETELITDYGDDVNKALAESLHLAWSKRDWSTIEGSLSGDVVHHDVASGETTRGFDDYKKWFEGFTKAFPDMSFEVERSWAAGDYVIVERRTRGTHTAKLGELEATNNAVDLQGLDIYRFEDGIIVEMWRYHDAAAFMAQVTAGQAAAGETQNK